MPSGSILGNAVPRLEDPALLTGAARFVGDMAPPRLAHAAFVRSTMASADIAGIDVGRAERAPGVVGVFTADRIGLAPTPSFYTVPPVFARPPLADGVVRFVGEPLAVVVAETPAQAADGAELVEVDYEPRPALTDPEAALEPDAPLLFPANGSNLASEYSSEAGPGALEGHDLVVSGRFVNQRVAAAPIEPTAVLAEPGAGGDDGGVTVWCTSQTPFGTRDGVAAALGLDPGRVRAIAPAVGGGFGAKAAVYPEYVVAAWLARRLGRPVRWIETRSENLVNMVHGRDYVQHYELGLTRDGDFRWLRARMTANVGAYPAVGAFLPSFTMSMASGPYQIPAVDFRALGAVTNTTPVGAFRGAGRPEATAAIERIVDLAAATLGMDPAELRRRNLLAPDQFPFETPTGAVMDCGDYQRVLDQALKAAGYDELRAEQRRRRSGGDHKLMGVGVSVYVEITGGLSKEYGSVEVTPDGTVVARAGTSSHGQGHVTSFTQLVSEVLGVPAERVRVVHSDTFEVPRGIGTIASRSLQIAGSAVFKTAQQVMERARRIAAHRLEASVEDIVAADDGSGLAVAGVPARAMSWADLAAASASTGDGDLPDGMAPGELAAEIDFDQGAATYPFGAHVAVVEVDSETGDARLVRHVAVDDCGRILNPMLVRGQVHGGITQGAAQALYEQVLYDDDGNPRTANFADYCLPGPTEVPGYETSHTETPTPLNPLGAKGIGESGTIGSLPAVQSAVIDALSDLGIRHLDMPYTPEKVWRAIAEASPSSA